MTGTPSATGSATAAKRKLLIFRPEAESDVQSSYDWYQKQSDGLGDEFLDALDQVITGIQRLPEQHPMVHADIRRALLRRFPYAVFYMNEPSRIVILAVMHQSRDPARWQDRK